MLKIRILKNQLGLLFRNGDFRSVLEPGAYILPGRLVGRDTVEVVDTLSTRFRHSKLDALVREPALQRYLTTIELGDAQRAVVWVDGRVHNVLGSGTYAHWNRPRDLRVETYDLAELRLDQSRLDAILQAPGAGELLQPIRVTDHTAGVLSVDGKVVEVLGPGQYAYWNTGTPGKVACQVIDLRETSVDVAGQEIMTADRVTLRVNLVVTSQVTDPAKVVSVVDDHRSALYREAQLVLRAAVGTRKLEHLLSDKAEVSAELRDGLVARAAEFGVAVRSIGLRDVILPGDMKTILNQVIEAEKQAEANLIRRREETAAARSQANTAKLLAENPTLVRMKELESLQEILKGTKATFVLGTGDLTDQIRGLVSGSDAV